MLEHDARYGPFSPVDFVFPNTGHGTILVRFEPLSCSRKGLRASIVNRREWLRNSAIFKGADKGTNIDVD